MKKIAKLKSTTEKVNDENNVEKIGVEENVIKEEKKIRVANPKKDTGIVLTRDEIMDLAEKCYMFCEKGSGVELYPYQREFGLRIIQSLLLEDNAEITALFSRQSGKTETVSTVVPGLCVILPILANLPAFSVDRRVAKFKHGFWVGIFAPNYELAGIMHTRMSKRITSTEMEEILKDPEININLDHGRKVLRLPNGSYVDSNSAGPQTSIEGKTYHLIICEETQDISDYKIRKSIHPMAAATGGTIIKIGTPAPRKCEFYEACERNRKKQLGQSASELKVHFEYDYTVASQYNPRYASYIEMEIERLGYDSDDFRMSYRLHWILERGTFISPEQLKECGIKKRDKLVSTGKKGEKLEFHRYDYTISSDHMSENMVAGIDIGRSSDSTIITVGKVWWENPIYRSGEERYYCHVMDWLELQGDDHEKQYPQIIEFLSRYNIGSIMIDATGRGDPIYDRLYADYNDKDISVFPFIFTAKSKHEGYTILYQELIEGRLTFPHGEHCAKLTKWRRFINQFNDLEKNWKGKYMAIEAPTTKNHRVIDKPHDDYPDSLMLMCWLVHRKNYGIETSDKSIFALGDNTYDRMRNNRGGITRRNSSKGRDRWDF
jgi:hypothetical protein